MEIFFSNSLRRVTLPRGSIMKIACSNRPPKPSLRLSQSLVGGEPGLGIASLLNCGPLRHMIAFGSLPFLAHPPPASTARDVSDVRLEGEVKEPDEWAGLVFFFPGSFIKVFLVSDDHLGLFGLILVFLLLMAYFSFLKQSTLCRLCRSPSHSLILFPRPDRLPLISVFALRMGHGYFDLARG